MRVRSVIETFPSRLTSPRKVRGKGVLAWLFCVTYSPPTVAMMALAMYFPGCWLVVGQTKVYDCVLLGLIVKDLVLTSVELTLRVTVDDSMYYPGSDMVTVNVT